MQEREAVAEQVAKRVFEYLEMPSSSSNSQNYATGLAVGVAVTAVAGVAVAAAVGGLLYYNEGALPFNLPFSTRRQHSPLTAEKWEGCFEREEGRLVDGGDKVIYKVRGGGVEPCIRAQVWPFLLGVYALDSNLAEREAVRFAKNEEYEDLRSRCVKAAETLRKQREAALVEHSEGAATSTEVVDQTDSSLR